jgi:WhiB family redox-sensing transcriptional regulator
LSHLDWHADAACRTADPDLFFQDGQGNSKLVTAMAKAFCARCPVVSPCLRDALGRDQQHGVWGNTSAEERKKLIRAGARKRLLGAVRG